MTKYLDTKDKQSIILIFVKLNHLSFISTFLLKYGSNSDLTRKYLFVKNSSPICQKKRELVWRDPFFNVSVIFDAFKNDFLKINVNCLY